jgi:phage terminase large subunit-like protein
MNKGGVKTSRSLPRDTSAQTGKKGWLADFIRFCQKLKSEDGKPLKIHEYQRRMLKAYFEGAIETVIIVPKKNGKTTLLGALALYHLETVTDAECVIGASSRDQATILFNQAAGLVRRAGLESTFDVKGGYREIRYGSGRIRVLAADANTADGVIPTLALVDELHRHPSAELYGVFRDGLGPRGGRMLTISTAGAQMDSPLGTIREKAHKMDGFIREGAYNYVESPDRSFVFHEWCLDAGDDPDDMKVVKTANPAPWHTVAALQRRHNSPTTTPWQWLRFACGIWTEGEEPWIEAAAWDRLAVDIGGIQDGEPVTLAVRAGVGCGIGIAALREGGAVAVGAEIIPAPNGGRVPLEVVERTLHDLSRRYAVREIAYDPEQFQRSAELLTERGLPMNEIPQRPLRLAQATSNMWRLISAGLLRHDGDPDLRSHVMAGRTKETVQGWYLVPTPRTAALIAVAMAVLQATQFTPTEFWVIPNATEV